MGKAERKIIKALQRTHKMDAVVTDYAITREGDETYRVVITAYLMPLK